MSGHRVVPQSTGHFYSATKYAVTALTEGLRQELREAQTHIRATVRVWPSPGGDGWAETPAAPHARGAPLPAPGSRQVRSSWALRSLRVLMSLTQEPAGGAGQLEGNMVGGA